MRHLLPLLTFIAALVVGSAADRSERAIGSIHVSQPERAARTVFARVDAVMLGDDTGLVLRKMGEPDLWGRISYNEFPQGQRSLNRSAGEDLQQEVVAPAAGLSLHGDAGFVWMLF